MHAMIVCVCVKTYKRVPLVKLITRRRVPTGDTRGLTAPTQGQAWNEIYQMLLIRETLDDATRSERKWRKRLGKGHTVSLSLQPPEQKLTGGSTVGIRDLFAGRVGAINMTRVEFAKHGSVQMELHAQTI